MAKLTSQQEKMDKKLKALDTIFITSICLLCLVTLPLAIIILVRHISGLMNTLCIATIVLDAISLVSFTIDIILGGKPIDNVRKNIKEPETVDEMTGIQFEKYVAEKLSAAGWCDVEVTPASGDHGVDVLGTAEGVRYAIQCKRYKSSVDTKAVQEVYTGRGVYGADRAVVITNSTFTRQAKEMAEKLDVELWNVDKLEEMVEVAE